MTISMLNLDLTPEEHQAVEAADVAAFAGLTPASDPIALAILAKWAAASGYIELYDLVSFAPYYMAAAERRSGWDDLAFLVSITAHLPGDTSSEAFKEIVESQDEERREEAFAYVDEQLQKITDAMQSAGGELVEALTQYRAEAAPAGGDYALSPEQQLQVPVVMEQPEQVAESIVYSEPVPGVEGDAVLVQPLQVAEVVDQVEEVPQQVVYTEPAPMPSLDQVVDWDTIQTENQRALKDAQQVGTRLPYWQLGQWILLGPGHSPQYYEEFTIRGAQNGDVTIVSRGSTLRRDPGLIRVSGCTDEDSFRTTIARFSAKRIEFVAAGADAAGPSLT